MALKIIGPENWRQRSQPVDPAILNAIAVAAEAVGPRITGVRITSGGQTPYRAGGVPGRTRTKDTTVNHDVEMVYNSLLGRLEPTQKGGGAADIKLEIDGKLTDVKNDLKTYGEFGKYAIAAGAPSVGFYDSSVKHMHVGNTGGKLNAKGQRVGSENRAWYPGMSKADKELLQGYVAEGRKLASDIRAGNPLPEGTPQSIVSFSQSGAVPEYDSPWPYFDTSEVPVPYSRDEQPIGMMAGTRDLLPAPSIASAPIAPIPAGALAQVAAAPQMASMPVPQAAPRAPVNTVAELAAQPSLSPAPVRQVGPTPPMDVVPGITPAGRQVPTRAPAPVMTDLNPGMTELIGEVAKGAVDRSGWQAAEAGFDWSPLPASAPQTPQWTREVPQTATGAPTETTEAAEVQTPTGTETAVTRETGPFPPAPDAPGYFESIPAGEGKFPAAPGSMRDRLGKAGRNAMIGGAIGGLPGALIGGGGTLIAQALRGAPQLQSGPSWGQERRAAFDAQTQAIKDRFGGKTYTPQDVLKGGPGAAGNAGTGLSAVSSVVDGVAPPGTTASYTDGRGNTIGTVTATPGGFAKYSSRFNQFEVMTPVGMAGPYRGKPSFDQMGNVTAESFGRGMGGLFGSIGRGLQNVFSSVPMRAPAPVQVVRPSPVSLASGFGFGAGPAGVGGGVGYSAGPGAFGMGMSGAHSNSTDSRGR